MEDVDNYQSEIESLKLDLGAVKKHQNALKKVTSGFVTKYLTIVDTCRLDNSGILNLNTSLESLKKFEGSGIHTPFAAFVPAAGAASRYIRPLSNLEKAIEESDLLACTIAVQQLKAQGADQWPLPELLSKLIREPGLCSNMCRDELATLKLEITLPKALMPCVAEGHSFLSLKMLEHRSIPEVGREFYIVPLGQAQTFSNHIDHLSHDMPAMPYKILEQHGGLSTIRFTPDCSPFKDTNGNLTVVPAGHGTLTTLFPQCVGPAHSLFIRNVDNVMGRSRNVVATTSCFLTLHDKVLTLVQQIRTSLKNNDLSSADLTAKKLLVLVPDEILRRNDLSQLESLWQVQAALFHSDVPKKRDLESLKNLFMRPVNTLGQVPNTGKDIGGTPCFVDFKGRRIKLCVEVPHVSDDDRAMFFVNPEKATHFNPVFAAAEITSDPELYQRQNNDFWLMAEKNHRGFPVIYYETVLYELIGNSALANTIFVEVPRSVFNPHKEMTNTVATSIADWLP